MRLPLFAALLTLGTILSGPSYAVPLTTGSGFATESQDLPSPFAHGPIGVPTGNVLEDISFPGCYSPLGTCIARSPWEGTKYDGNPYTSVDSPSAGGSTDTFDLGGSHSVLSLLWGSPDSYNTLELLFGNLVVGSLSGAVLGPPPSPGAGYDFVTIYSNVAFDHVRLTSTSAAFEVANVSAVPVPPALMLFGSGIAGLGFLARRRRWQASVG